MLVERVGDETVVYDTVSEAAHCLGELASIVFEHCDGRTKTHDLAVIASARLGRDVSDDEVAGALAQLDERQLLSAPPLLVHEGGVSRRQLMRRAVIGGAVALPLITSVALPDMAAAAPTPPPCAGCNCCCTNSNQCCVGQGETSGNVTCQRPAGCSGGFPKACAHGTAGQCPSTVPTCGTISCNPFNSGFC